DELGWTQEQAQAFINRWREMQQRAASKDAEKLNEYQQTLRSLGLRPRGVRSAREVPTETQGGEAEGRRSKPPSEYREQVRAFLQGAKSE
ncbi:MAG: hypothetical protein KAT44_07225, partial [Pirellulales bacterium]|nr:hypothetical protein [Pirellulales bacterium]